MRARGIVAVTAAAGFVMAGLALPAASQAAPPPPAPLTTAADPVAVNQTRLTFTPAFLSALGASGDAFTYTGTVGSDGTSRTFAVGKQFDEGYFLNGTLTMRSNSGATRTCTQLLVATFDNSIKCSRGDGTSYTLFRLVNGTTTVNGRITTQTATVRIASVGLALWLNRTLGTRAFTTQPVVATLESVRRKPLRGGYIRDPYTGCEEDNYAGDNSIWRGWGVQTTVNGLPQGLTVSRLDPTTGVLTTPEPQQNTVGQRTPRMEGLTTGDSKLITAGSQYSNDNFYSGYFYGCNTNAAFVIAPGAVNEAKTWNYDGVVRTQANSGNGLGRPQWWAHPRQTDYNGPQGSYSWTCRGTPSGKPKQDTWWARVDHGSGFFGDNGTDQVQAQAGVAPECSDANLQGMDVRTWYSISKRGGLEGRNDSSFPRGCEVQSNSPVVGCWQETYPVWDRAWAFASHIYASALVAELQSDVQFKVPSTYDPGGIGYTGPVRWRIVGADISGAWPKFKDADGTTWDAAGIEKALRNQNFAVPSEFTVPGDNSVYTLGGYGSPSGEQFLNFSLVADSIYNADTQTWEWPSKTGVPGTKLPRLEIKVRLGYTISNFDDGGSCVDKVWYDDSVFSGVDDIRGPHCLKGTVPTLWPLPSARSDYWKRIHDQWMPDPSDPNKKIPTKPNVTFSSTVVKGCYNDTQIKVQDLSIPTAPAVGAHFTWPIKLTGLVDSFTSC